MSVGTEEQRLLDRMTEENRVLRPIIERLMAADPLMPYYAAHVMAGDLAEGERNLAALREGKMTWERAEGFTGSYGRLDLRCRAYEEGLISFSEYIADLASAWSSADPDDTDPRFLSLWKDAFRKNNYRRLSDRRNKLPSGPLHVYRGQDEDAPFGISWSLSEGIALKFARGAATRQSNRHGVVYCGRVERPYVMAYITGRNEREVIVDPHEVLRAEVVQRA